MGSLFDKIFEHSLVVISANGREVLWHRSVHGYGYAPMVRQPYLNPGERLEYRVVEVRPPAKPPAEFAVSCHG